MRDINDKLSSVKGPLVDVLEKLRDRKRNLETAQSELVVYRAQLQPVQEVFTQVEETAVLTEPLDLDRGEDELDKVDVSSDLWPLSSNRDWVRIAKIYGIVP